MSLAIRKVSPRKEPILSESLRFPTPGPRRPFPATGKTTRLETEPAPPNPRQSACKPGSGWARLCVWKTGSEIRRATPEATIEPGLVQDVEGGRFRRLAGLDRVRSRAGVGNIKHGDADAMPRKLQSPSGHVLPGACNLDESRFHDSRLRDLNITPIVPRARTATRELSPA